MIRWCGDALIDVLPRRFAHGLRTPGLKARLVDLEDRKQRLEEDLSAAPRPVPRLHPNLAEIYRAKVEALHEALAEAGERDEALGLLRGFIERIDMAPVDGGFEIELTGNIAHMVEASLAGPSSKKAVLNERMACSVKVVAGAPNHRDLTLRMPI